VSNPFDVLAARVDALSRQTRGNSDALAEIRHIAETAHRALDELVDRVATAERLAAGAVTAIAHQRDDVSGQCRVTTSWLAEPRDNALPELVAWIDCVLIHYPGTADALSNCWPFHPWVVEELMALQAAWTESYQGERANGTRAVDWHDRHRPATIARIRANIADCSVDAHEPGRRADHMRFAAVPGGSSVAAAMSWWLAQRSG
jgi:hypothetical protein